jgi:hypothetical protein
MLLDVLRIKKRSCVTSPPAVLRTSARKKMDIGFASKPTYTVGPASCSTNSPVAVR